MKLDKIDGILGSIPVITEPSHSGAEFGWRAAIIPTMTSYFFFSMRGGNISLKIGRSHSPATLQSTPGSQKQPNIQDEIALGTHVSSMK
jgi:hypothetical protein